MLATLTEDYFSDPDWLFERKLDGERRLVFRKGESIRLMSRNRKEPNDTYPELEDAIKQQAKLDLFEDGEIVAFQGGRTSFARLQHRMQVRNREEARQSGIKVWLYVFDLLHAGGADLTRLPLRERKKLLRSVFDFRDPIQFTPHRNRDGERYHREARAKGWEGVIAKDAGAEYVHSRSRKWLKFKCSKGQELVSGDSPIPRAAASCSAPCWSATPRKASLSTRGKWAPATTTKPSATSANAFRSSNGGLRHLGRAEPPTRGVHWVTPKLVGEFHFTEWIRDNRLRHPSFTGLRRDRKTGDVAREAP